MKRSLLLIVSSLLTNMAVVCAETINIAAVNNPDMVELKKLSAKFVEKNPGVTLNWILLEENLLRQRVTVDVSTGSGQFDLVFIGLYETPLFAKKGWLKPMDGLSSEYDVEDVFVAADIGWASVPPGTRKSTYENPEYQKAAPFAQATLQAMETADPTDPCVKKVPYTGITFVGIPEFQSFGSLVGQNVAGVVAGKMSVEKALKDSQALVERAMKQAGYIK